MDNVLGVSLIVLVLIFWTVVILFFVLRKSAPVKTVKAQVCDKYKPNVISKYPETGGEQRCVVVFKTKDGKLSFDVSVFSYNNYRIKKKGTLKYRGNRIISFK